MPRFFTAFFVTLTFSGLLRSTYGAESVLRSLDQAPVVHFTLTRRGGTFEATRPGNDSIEMDLLLEQLEMVEGKFNLTRREVRGNKLVRKAKSQAVGGRDDDGLMGEMALNGSWFANLAIGEPPQTIDLDLNMLTSDFYVRHTTSHVGTRYDDFFSNRFDVFHLPTLDKAVPLPFAYCRPLKGSQQTLKASGSILGLAPSKYLRQIETPFLLYQLLQEGIVKRPIFSIVLLSGRDGVLSIGGTAAQAAEMVDKQTSEELDRAGAQEKIIAFTKENGKTLQSGFNSLDKSKLTGEKIILHKRETEAKDFKATLTNWAEGWTWVKVQGAEGWWQTLMQGVWINTPFILAPPLAAKTFYASVAGSRPLDPPYSNFYVFPCMNPPSVEFEFSGTRFPAMRGGRGLEYNSAIIPGGKFSLGRLKHGSGYCVGAIVETRMGLKEEKEGMTGSGKQGLGSAGASVGSFAGNGMRDVWVIGEGFFRGVGGVFDFEEKRIGFRVY
ncbi:MAG: hypothetical protein LQ338_000139 [Usnochroma carphineum]|nr:MAG: hypothetical protein LQ338_000139 [Usnochroma carphineum]